MRISFRFSVGERVWVIDKEEVFQAIITKAIYDGKTQLYEVNRFGEITLHKQKNLKREDYKGYKTCE